MSVKLNGQFYKKGDRFTFTAPGKSQLGIPNNAEIVLYSTRDGGGGDMLVGLHCLNKKIDSWGDLDGYVGSRQGWWLGRRELEKLVMNADITYVVCVDVQHRGIELRGKPCKLIVTTEEGFMFVEFEEDVGGCSADGYGKAGKCVALMPGSVAIKKPDKKPDKKKKKPSKSAVKAARKKAVAAAKGKV